MQLTKTIENIKNSKHSFFNLKSGKYLNLDLFRIGLKIEYKSQVHDYEVFFIDKKYFMSPTLNNNIFFFYSSNIFNRKVFFTPYIFVNSIVKTRDIDWCIKLV